MDNKKRNQQANETPATEQPTVETQAATQAEPTIVGGPNFVLTYRREHPGNRCSYGIAGNSGIVVFDKGLIQGSDQPGFTMPPTITLDCQLVPIKADNKTAKAEAAAAKLVERARKAQEKIEVAAKKAADRQAKADAALAAAKAKVEAANALKAAADAGKPATA